MGTDDDEPLDQPQVQAVVVPGTAPDTEAVDVLVIWDDLAGVQDVAKQVLAVGLAEMLVEPRFAGEVRFIVPAEFIPDNRANRRAIAAMTKRLVEAVGGTTTLGGQPIVPTVSIVALGGDETDAAPG
jgi:hypothetical protein